MPRPLLSALLIVIGVVLALPAAALAVAAAQGTSIAVTAPVQLALAGIRGR